MTSQSSSSTVGLGVIAVLLVLGVGMILYSFATDEVTWSSRAWTRKDAEQTIETGLRAKALVHQRAHGQPVSEDAVSEAQNDYQVQRDRLDRARSAGGRAILSFRWGGVAVVLVAVTAFAMFYRSNDNR